MAEANLIGKGRFAPPLELLPGERVLWSGGAMPRAVFVLLLRIAFVVLLPLAFMVTMVMLPSGRHEREAPAREASAGRDCPGRAECAPARAADATPAAASPAPGAEQSRAPEGPSRAGKVFFGLLVAMVAFFAAVVLGSLVDCWLRVRHAWYVITTERVCIRSGGWTNTLTVMDLDKVISVRAEASWLEARLGLQTIELTHASGVAPTRNAYAAYLSPNPYAIALVPAGGPLLSELVNHWLPRDNRRAGG